MKNNQIEDIMEEKTPLATFPLKQQSGMNLQEMC